MKWVLLVLSFIMMFGCQSTTKKPKPAPASSSLPSSSTSHTSARGQDPCAPIIEHDERHYTAGGLYAPHLSDSAPVGAIDVSKLVEPTPRVEPKSPTGNRSPYSVLGKQYWVMPSAAGYDERGIASWYGQKFNGRKTSSGEIYSVCEFTAAHKTLPLPSIVRVTHIGNGRSVMVRVNDRGPFHAGRIIDLSYAAAIKLGLDKTGTANVRVQTINADGSASNIPDSTPPANLITSSASKLTLQFGSFAQRDNANRLMNQLQAANIRDVTLIATQNNTSTLWRVMGSVADQQEIDGIFEKIRQMGLPKPTVIPQKL
jgi:rare lipoprotein A